MGEGRLTGVQQVEELKGFAVGQSAQIIRLLMLGVAFMCNCSAIQRVQSSPSIRSTVVRHVASC